MNDEEKRALYQRAIAVFEFVYRMGDSEFPAVVYGMFVRYGFTERETRDAIQFLLGKGKLVLSDELKLVVKEE